MPSYYKKNNFVCHTKEELLGLFSSKKQDIFIEMLKSNITFDDLKKDFSKIEGIVDIVVKKSVKSKDEVEIFLSLFSFLDFYENNSLVCFKMKSSFNSETDKINTLKELIQAREECTDNDFTIKTKDDFRVFQLKRYREKISTQEIFSFIKKKIKHYGNNLGDTNLLILLQAEAYSQNHIDFHELHSKIKLLDYNFKGEILITWNEMNKNDIIVQIYPKLKKNMIPFILPSLKIKKNKRRIDNL